MIFVALYSLEFMCPRIASANVFTDTIDFQDLKLPLGQATTLTSYAGLVWQNFKVIRSNILELGGILTILSAAWRHSASLAGLILQMAVSLGSMLLEHGSYQMRSTHPCSVTSIGKNNQGAEVARQTTKFSPASSGGLPIDGLPLVGMAYAVVYGGVTAITGMWTFTSAITTAVFEVLPTVDDSPRMGRRDAIIKAYEEKGLMFTVHFYQLKLDKKF
ncbi:hypothetical protein TWF694_002836 [Orbilia ellipsospora]|uniref:Uncharacterized protein n=1 Tax=Orbilia ellipsospora TaxID=2528407 RepID=A0AAV9WZV5_9PEZI